jgi:hypothetical protein
MVSPARAHLAVMVTPLLAAALACTERVPLLSAEPAAGDPPPEVDAGAPGDSAPVDARQREVAESIRCHEMTQHVRLESHNPEVVVALDRSFSMFDGKRGRSWWEAVRQELTAYMRNNEGGIMFGYEEFPARASCDRQTGCCGSRVLVPPLLNSSWEVERKLRCDSIADGCYTTTNHAPGADALAAIRTFYEGEPDPEPDRFVLLITDKEPACPADPDHCQEAGVQAAKLFSMGGVKTIVLGLGEQTRTSACLETVATAGQTREPGATPFPWAAEPAQLKEQLARAMAPIEARACRFTVRSDIQNWQKISVTVNYMPLARDPSHKEGWDFDPPGTPEIQLYGAACTKLKCAQLEHRAVRASLDCTQCGSIVSCQ